MSVKAVFYPPQKNKIQPQLHKSYWKYSNKHTSNENLKVPVLLETYPGVLATEINMWKSIYPLDESRGRSSDHLGKNSNVFINAAPVID